MAEISAAAVKVLRERTGLPMMDCKKAVNDAAGDADKAVELLRKAGAKMMEKRAGRATISGRIGVYVAPDAAGGAMIDLRCETPRWPPTSTSSNWPTTWLGNWPWAQAPIRPTRSWPSRRPARTGKR